MIKQTNDITGISDIGYRHGIRINTRGTWKSTHQRQSQPQLYSSSHRLDPAPSPISTDPSWFGCWCPAAEGFAWSWMNETADRDDRQHRFHHDLVAILVPSLSIRDWDSGCEGVCSNWMSWLVSDVWLGWVDRFSIRLGSFGSVALLYRSPCSDDVL